MYKRKKNNLLILLLSLLLAQASFSLFSEASSPTNPINAASNEEISKLRIKPKNNRILAANFDGGDIKNYPKHWYPICDGFFEHELNTMVSIILLSKLLIITKMNKDNKLAPLRDAVYRLTILPVAFLENWLMV